MCILCLQVSVRVCVCACVHVWDDTKYVNICMHAQDHMFVHTCVCVCVPTPFTLTRNPNSVKRSTPIKSKNEACTASSPRNRTQQPASVTLYVNWYAQNLTSEPKTVSLHPHNKRIDHPSTPVITMMKPLHNTTSNDIITCTKSIAN